MSKFNLIDAVVLSTLPDADKNMLVYIINRSQEAHRWRSWPSTARLAQARGMANPKNFKGVKTYLGDLVKVTEHAGRHFAKDAGVTKWKIDPRIHGYELNVNAILALEPLTVDYPSPEGESKEPTKGVFCDQHKRKECVGQKNDGGKCHGSSIPGSEYCHRHVPNPSPEGEYYPSPEGVTGQTLPSREGSYSSLDSKEIVKAPSSPTPQAASAAVRKESLSNKNDADTIPLPHSAGTAPDESDESSFAKEMESPAALEGKGESTDYPSREGLGDKLERTLITRTKSVDTAIRDDVREYVRSLLCAGFEQDRPDGERITLAIDDALWELS